MQMEARKFLSQIEKIEYMIANKKVEAEQWNDIANNITSQVGGERVQSSGSQDKMASAVIEVVEIKSQIKILEDTYKDVVSVIEQLEARYYNFIHKVYVQHLTVKEVASMEGKSYSWATTTHKKALKEVQKILDGRGKSYGY